MPRWIRWIRMILAGIASLVPAPRRIEYRFPTVEEALRSDQEAIGGDFDRAVKRVFSDTVRGR